MRIVTDVLKVLDAAFSKGEDAFLCDTVNDALIIGFAYGLLFVCLHVKSHVAGSIFTELLSIRYVVVFALEEAILDVVISQEKLTKEPSAFLNSIDVPLLGVEQSVTSTPPTLVTELARRAVLEITERA